MREEDPVMSDQSLRSPLNPMPHGLVRPPRSRQWVKDKMKRVVSLIILCGVICVLGGALWGPLLARFETLRYHCFYDRVELSFPDAESVRQLADGNMGAGGIGGAIAEGGKGFSRVIGYDGVERPAPSISTMEYTYSQGGKQYRKKCGRLEEDKPERGREFIEVNDASGRMRLLDEDQFLKKFPQIEQGRLKVYAYVHPAYPDKAVFFRASLERYWLTILVTSLSLLVLLYCAVYSFFQLIGRIPSEDGRVFSSAIIQVEKEKEKQEHAEWTRGNRIYLKNVACVFVGFGLFLWGSSGLTILPMALLSGGGVGPFFRDIVYLLGCVIAIYVGTGLMVIACGIPYFSRSLYLLKQLAHKLRQ